MIIVMIGSSGMISVDCEEFVFNEGFKVVNLVDFFNGRDFNVLEGSFVDDLFEEFFKCYIEISVGVLSRYNFVNGRVGEMSM